MGSFKADGKTLLAIFVGLIMVVVIIDIVGDQIFDVTNTLSVTNDTITSPTSGSDLSIVGRGLIGSVVAHNNTENNGSVIPTTNYTVATKVVNGGATLVFTNNDADWNSVSVNLSYSFEPDGYVREASSRAVVNLVLIFAAIAILVFVIVMLKKGGVLKNVMGMK